MGGKGADACAGIGDPVISLAFNALGECLRIVLDPTKKDR